MRHQGWLQLQLLTRLHQLASTAQQPSAARDNNRRRRLLAAGLACSSSLCAEAVAKACKLEGQLLLGQSLVHVHGPQRHLCRASQAQGGVLHRVYLRGPVSVAPHTTMHISSYRPQCSAIGILCGC